MIWRVLYFLGYYAFRRPDTGSWFIKRLCEVLSKPEAGNQPLTKLLTSAIRHVAVKNESRSANPKISGKKQTPCFASMLTKDVYFKQKSTWWSKHVCRRWQINQDQCYREFCDLNKILNLYDLFQFLKWEHRICFNACFILILLLCQLLHL